jgi:inhibitor of KinA sporulation pathway (predicted exonuclease)
MNYLVTDLECICTNSNKFPREKMEIIEIGAVLLKSQLEIIFDYNHV